MKLIRSTTCTVVLAMMCLGHSASARAEASPAYADWESLGAEPLRVLSIETPGALFDAAFGQTDAWRDQDFTSLAIRDFPELGITVPESGPGAQDFYRSLSILTGRGRPDAANVLASANSPFKQGGKETTRLEFIQHNLEQAGLPRILAWMVAQESGFNDQAHSSAGAWGAWQFIIKTAERFDLDIKTTTVVVSKRKQKIRTRTVQECTGCKNLDHATRAAGEYLSEMYNGAAPEKFYRWKNWTAGMPIIRWKGDFSLAMAAYNTGEHNVAKAIYNNGGKQADFWTLRSSLHPQTQHYVPVILAWMRIGQDPKKFGF